MRPSMHLLPNYILFPLSLSFFIFCSNWSLLFLATGPLEVDSLIQSLTKPMWNISPATVKWNKTNHWQQIHVSASRFKSPCKNKDKFGTSWKIFSKGASGVQKTALDGYNKIYKKMCQNHYAGTIRYATSLRSNEITQKTATLERVSNAQRSRS